jgi:hypothetical protein
VPNSLFFSAIKGNHFCLFCGSVFELLDIGDYLADCEEQRYEKNLFNCGVGFKGWFDFV